MLLYNLYNHYPNSGLPVLRYALILLLFVLPLNVLKATEATTPAAKPLVVVSLQPLALLVSDLAGDTIDLRLLNQAGGDPHHMQLSFSDRQWLERADLMLWVGPEMERPMTKLAALKAQRQPGSVLTFSALSGLRWPEDAELMSEEGEPLIEDDHHDHHHSDNHVWLNPKNSQILLSALAQELSRLLPDSEALFNQRLVKLEQNLVRWQTENREAFINSAVEYSVYHPGYDHFNMGLGINQLAVVQSHEGQKPSARQLYKLSQQLPEGSCLLVEQNYQQAGQSVAEHLTLNLQVVDILGREAEGYLGLMDDLVGRLQPCVKL